MAAPPRLPNIEGVSAGHSSTRMVAGRLLDTESVPAIAHDNACPRGEVAPFQCPLPESVLVIAYDTARAEPQIRVSAIAQYIPLLAS